MVMDEIFHLIKYLIDRMLFLVIAMQNLQEFLVLVLLTVETVFDLLDKLSCLIYMLNNMSIRKLTSEMLDSPSPSISSVG